MTDYYVFDKLKKDEHGRTVYAGITVFIHKHDVQNARKWRKLMRRELAAEV